MRSRLCVVGLGLMALCGTASPSRAGGPGVVLGAIRGTVEIKSVAPGGQWRKAGPGELLGTYLLRTGPRSSVHLQEPVEVARGERPSVLKFRSVACVDSNSVVRIQSRCGYRVQVVQGRLSKADGKSGKSLGPEIGG